MAEKAEHKVERAKEAMADSAETASSEARGLFSGVKDTFSNVAHKVAGGAETAECKCGQGRSCVMPCIHQVDKGDRDG